MINLTLGDLYGRKPKSLISKEERKVILNLHLKTLCELSVEAIKHYNFEIATRKDVQPATGVYDRRGSAASITTINNINYGNNYTIGKIDGNINTCPPVCNFVYVTFLPKYKVRTDYSMTASPEDRDRLFDDHPQHYHRAWGVFRV